MPQVQHPYVPTTSGRPPQPPPPPPPPMVQWSETTRMPTTSHRHNTPVAPGPHSSPPPQAPLMMSHSLSQHDGMSGAAHVYPRVPITRACILTSSYVRSLSNLLRDLSRGQLEQRGTCGWPRLSGGNVPSRPPCKGTAKPFRLRRTEMS
jgi:hypothetical protein